MTTIRLLDRKELSFVDDRWCAFGYRQKSLQSRTSTGSSKNRIKLAWFRINVIATQRGIGAGRAKVMTTRHRKTGPIRNPKPVALSP